MALQPAHWLMLERLVSHVGLAETCHLPEGIVELQAACSSQQGQVPGAWLDGHVRSGGCSRAAANAADGRLDVHAGQIDLRGVSKQAHRLVELPW